MPLEFAVVKEEGGTVRTLDLSVAGYVLHLVSVQISLKLERGAAYFANETLSRGMNDGVSDELLFRCEAFRAFLALKQIFCPVTHLLMIAQSNSR